jgi:hypothetical protein
VLTAMIAIGVSGTVFAAMDLSDFDQDTMQAVDDAKKELESGLAAKESKEAVANAEFIRDSLQWAEGYFAKKGNVDDAVKWAREGREFAAAIATSVGRGDFDAASESYNSLVRTCKSCHDVYKPPSL